MRLRDKRRPSSLLPLLVATLGSLFGPGLVAQEPGKALLVPHRFLRGYDPITVLYEGSVGPQGGGPLSGPSPYLSVSPSLDGEYRWEDGRTVRFLPSEPWKPLTSYTVSTLGGTFTLRTMLSSPLSVSPSPSSSAMEPFSSFLLTFPGPIDSELLKSTLRLELRDLPGISAEGATALPEGAFTVTELEAGKKPDRVTYRVSLAETVPYGKRLIARLLLSTDPSLADSVAEYRWDTKGEFRLVAFGGGSTRLPVSASGGRYAEDQAVDCGTGTGPLFLEFSERLGGSDMERIKAMVSFTPAVKNLAFELSGSRVYLRFDADREKLYRLSVSPAGMVSSEGRVVENAASSAFHFYYRQGTAFVAWKDAETVVERYGPRQLPMESRGVGRLDLRIQKIDPLSWDFQPFPTSPVAIDEDSRPPMPGEEPSPGTDVAGHIRLLGSPPVSALVDLPVSQSSPRSTWGLDLGSYLDGTFGTRAPGTYLVGYRMIGSSSTRYWTRVTVTDLCLTGAEEERAVQFLVTSLSSADPVSGATVRIEGRERGDTVLIAQGVTDKDGRFRYEHRRAASVTPSRVVVQKDGDTLVLRCDQSPESFANNHWSRRGSWLSWLASEPRAKREEARAKAWVTTERPVYRPDEPVHVVGWVRDWRLGRIEGYSGEDLVIRVNGPGDKTWTKDAELSPSGTVRFDFDEKGVPTGEYQVSLVTKKRGSVLSSAPFKILAYRIPLFEVDVAGPDRVPLDRPFDLLLTATYYSGGRVTGEEASWEIEQYPWRYSSSAFPDFVFSADERFAQIPRAAAVETGTRATVLDQDGAARLTLDPRLERDGRARRYVVTGTVRGADRQAVTHSKTVYALPPFSVGLKAPKLVKGSKSVSAQFLAIDHLEKPLAGVDLTVRLVQRQWHSYVAETDFVTGEAKYVSEAVDVPVEERRLVSSGAPSSLDFQVPEPGVYVLELSSLDYLGRRISASSDFFVSAEGQVAWERKTSSLFAMRADKAEYKPGETATLILESPYKEGWALLAVEEPDGNRYESVRVQDGKALVEIPLRNEMAPRLSVQAILYRGRSGGPSTTASKAAAEAASPFEAGKPDLGKPATVGSSLTLKIRNEENRVAVTVDHPKKATPGETVDVTITAADEKGAPLDGEATLWLVDRAVLSLGTERDLDPLPAFIDRLESALRISDTRNRAAGYIPVSEVPGGDGMDAFATADSSSRSTVRKNMKTVPYFKTGIPVKGGRATVKVELPDNLTDFAVRVVVTSGFDRFGAARSTLPVRLAVALQNVVPRFIRPGDSTVAGGTARVVEGEGGAADWVARLGGLTVPYGTALSGSVTLPQKDAVRLFFPLSAPGDLLSKGGEASVELEARRLYDGVRDAFRVDLPVKPDSRPRSETVRLSLQSGQRVTLPAPALPAREGTVERTFVVATDERLLAIAQGLRYLDEYPHGCLEQQTSQLYPSIALSGFLSSLGLPSDEARLRSSFSEYQRYLASCQDDATGLFAYWPISRGKRGPRPSVSLTAYVVEFLSQCSKAGYPVNGAALERAKSGLSQALRSDSSLWSRTWADFERIEAFSALQAAGRWERSYASRFLNGALDYDLMSRARLYQALNARGAARGSKASALLSSLSDSLVITKERGKEVLSGVKNFRAGSSVLLTETRTIAAVLETLSVADKKNKNLELLAEWLIARGGDDGWGSTMDTVAALRALSAWLSSAPAGDLVLDLDDGTRLTSKDARVASFTRAGTGSGGWVSARKGAEKGPLTVLVNTRYQSSLPGSAQPSENRGFLVKRAYYPVDEDGRLGSAVEAAPGARISFPMDAVVEEKVTLVNFKDADFVALEVPLAAGLEPLDPRLAGAVKEATPSGRFTLEPSYTLSLDDRVVYYYDSLPVGSYDFYFRVRASFEGRYTAPPARAELMYDGETWGTSDGCGVDVTLQ